MVPSASVAVAVTVVAAVTKTVAAAAGEAIATTGAVGLTAAMVMLDLPLPPGFSAVDGAAFITSLLGVADEEALTSLAASVSSSAGVVFVPALAGLGAPHWDPYARGTLMGLSRGSNRGHIARAALEAIAYQSAELMAAKDAELKDVVGFAAVFRPEGRAMKEGERLKQPALARTLPAVPRGRGSVRKRSPTPSMLSALKYLRMTLAWCCRVTTHRSTPCCARRIAC